MHLMDLRERLGPYWASYQAKRRRDRIIDDPDYVPPWFLAHLARGRVAAARVALEKLLPPLSNGLFDERRELWRALQMIEQFIREGHALDPAVEQVVAGLLGAEEIETERERRDVLRERLRAGFPSAGERVAREHRERVELAKRHLRERGISTSSQLAALHADEDTDRETVRRAQWRALDELAEEERARA